VPFGAFVQANHVQHATFQEKEAWLNQGDPVTQQSSLSK
jgi:hypothetical protein